MQRELWPTPAALSARLARFGWRVSADGTGWRSWRLEGNGDPAWFGSLEGLDDWLSHQEARHAG